MKLYDKKFLMHRNCIKRSFGQPGLPEILVETADEALFYIF